MNAILLKITNLGKVRDSEITLSPLMVFSGESGLGKSYLALLCHYIFEIMVDKKRMNQFFVDLGHDYATMAHEFGDTGQALNINKHQLEDWLSTDALRYIAYMLGNDNLEGQISISLPEDFPDSLVYSYKTEFTGLVNAEDVDTILTLEKLSLRVKETTQFDESPFSFLLRYVLIDHLFGDFNALSSTFVMPPSRGPVITEMLIPMTGMYSEFQKDMTDITQIQPRYEITSHSFIEMLNKIQEGDVKRENGKYVYTTADYSIPVSAAAASIREVAPLQMLCRRIDVSRCSILFEEPEAHLHPMKQRRMADIIYSICSLGTMMQITTHSDYLIRRLNELMMFFKISRSLEATKRDELREKMGIDFDSELISDNVKSYLLVQQPDGTSRAVLQDLSQGIPYSSFREALMANLNNSYLLNEYCQDESGRVI